MTRFLLLCPCASRIEVAAAQAGGTVTCPSCGAAVAVPRLGALARLEVAAAAKPAARTGAWDSARAWMLAGVIVATLAAGVAGWLRSRRAGVAPLAAQAIRSAVEQASAARVHQSWLDFERGGIARPPVPEEQRRVRQADVLRGLEVVAWSVAAAGVGAAGIAAIAAGRFRNPAGSSAG